MALATAISIGAGIAGGLFGANKLSGGGLFGKIGNQIANPLPMPQAPSAMDAGDKADKIVKAKRASATQSIYTSPLGVAGEAGVARKTLLGQ